MIVTPLSSLLDILGKLHFIFASHTVACNLDI